MILHEYDWVGFFVSALYKQFAFLYINLIGRNDAVHVLEEDSMKLLSSLALAASAVCAVAFSPGSEILFAVAIILMIFVSLVAFVHSPPTWLKTLLAFRARAVDNRLTGYGHTHLRADGLGAGGRHGPPRTIAVLVMLAVWTLLMLIFSRVGHAISKLATSGHLLARNNMSAQPLPA